MSESTSIEERFGKCPYATAQSLISGKWAMLILHCLADGPVRFNELQRLMPKMTHATLSVQLKTLVENGIVVRTQYEDMPLRVEYSLSEIGQKFQPVLDELQKWGNGIHKLYEQQIRRLKNIIIPRLPINLQP